MLADLLTNNFYFKKVLLLYCVGLEILEIKSCDDKSLKW